MLRIVCCALLVVFFMSSCDDKTVLASYKATENGSWSQDNAVQFEFADLDTISSYNMFINIRNDETFPYSNLFLIAELKAPNGEVVTDTLEYEMAKANGEWLGKGYGSLKENKLWYQENIVLESSGVYTLRLSHAMRKNGSVHGIMNLEGITDVGFQIEKSN